MPHKHIVHSSVVKCFTISISIENQIKFSRIKIGQNFDAEESHNKEAESQRTKMKKILNCKDEKYI